MLGLKERPRSENHITLRREDRSGLGLLPQDLFMKLLCLERKRTERSGRRFVLMLLDPGSLLKSGKAHVMANLLSAISRSTRDTDITGWYRNESIIGVIFTELGDAADNSIVRTLSTKLTDSLYGALSVPEINEIKLSFHVFPEDWDDPGQNGPAKTTLRTALNPVPGSKRLEFGAKRLMDVFGSLVGLLLALPVMLLIALAVKLTSGGPIFFRQVRLGQHGKKFTFLKFRSMYANNDPKIHQEYVAKFIVGGAGTEQATVGKDKIYKLTKDPRITPVGRFLRSTSLDELPQFINVLRGEMSLAGPRPPLTYEFERYSLWHRQRLAAVKPGITGLWQVNGRSRVTFEDMVRLDIRYARSWSLWLDIKILLRTPGAVFSGMGAC